MGPRRLFFLLVRRVGGRFPNGFTNKTVRRGEAVVKRFRGPGADRRFRCEVGALEALRGRLPVPGLLGSDEARLTVRMRFVPGPSGDSREVRERPEAYLESAGAVLRQLHELKVRHFADHLGLAPGGTPVNGDYNPYNLVFERGSTEVAAVLDWEQAHPGEPITDLAWFEWVVRANLPALRPGLPAFFAGYGSRPGWPARKREMVRRCAEIAADAASAGEVSGAAYWSRWLEATRGWEENDR